METWKKYSVIDISLPDLLKNRCQNNQIKNTKHVFAQREKYLINLYFDIKAAQFSVSPGPKKKKNRAELVCLSSIWKRCGNFVFIEGEVISE